MLEAPRRAKAGGGVAHLETDDPLIPPFHSLQAILSMLQDMNFINNYKIDCPTLARCVSPALPSVQAAPSLPPS